MAKNPKCPFGGRCLQSNKGEKGCQIWVNMINRETGNVVGNCGFSWISVLVAEHKDMVERAISCIDSLVLVLRDILEEVKKNRGEGE